MPDLNQLLLQNCGSSVAVMVDLLGSRDSDSRSLTERRLPIRLALRLGSKEAEHTDILLLQILQAPKRWLIGSVGDTVCIGG